MRKAPLFVLKGSSLLSSFSPHQLWLCCVSSKFWAAELWRVVNKWFSRCLWVNMRDYSEQMDSPELEGQGNSQTGRLETCLLCPCASVPMKTNVKTAGGCKRKKRKHRIWPQCFLLNVCNGKDVCTNYVFPTSETELIKSENGGSVEFNELSLKVSNVTWSVFNMWILY